MITLDEEYDVIDKIEPGDVVKLLICNRNVDERYLLFFIEQKKLTYVFDVDWEKIDTIGLIGKLIKITSNKSNISQGSIFSIYYSVILGYWTYNRIG